MCGFNYSKINYVLGRYDILLLQEHWLNNNKLATFNCYCQGYCVHEVSALDSPKLLIGRSNGGVLIIYPDTFGAKAKFIPTTPKRLWALSLHMSNIILHLFCVYMPCDINNDSNIY